MTPQAFRKLALSFDGAVELPHFERASFRIGKKIFATLAEKDDEAMVRIAPPARALELVAKKPATFFSYGHWTERMGALGVHLSKADERTLKPLVADAWSTLASQEKSDARPRRTRPPSPKRRTKRG
jgi:hypothetical protein